MNDNTINRRSLFKAGSIAAASLVTGATVRAATVEGARPRALRVAHVTDIHLTPERAASFAQLLHQVQEQKPDLILNGGDSIIDAYGRSGDTVKPLWDAFSATLKSDCSLPMHAVIGNHDIWGWDQRRSGTTGAEPLYGKNWAMDFWQVQKPYRSFDQNGWHFILLDSCQLIGGHYSPRLDPEQLEWLRQDLSNTPKTTPILIMSHMPIFSVCPLVMGYIDEMGAWAFFSGLMHTDSALLRNLFAQHPNVKVAVSGHTHLSDEVKYNGVTYCCDGAVCGAWWRGPYRECRPGFAVLDLYADGSMERTWVNAKWAEGMPLNFGGRRGPGGFGPPPNPTR